MTKDEWNKVQADLSHPWGVVELLVDGYEVTLAVSRTQNPLKFEIMTYVNGCFKPKWMNGDSEEARRFFRSVTRPVVSPAKKKQLTKGVSKTFIKEHLSFLDETRTVFYPFWIAFAPLKRHLIANNKSIELARRSPKEEAEQDVV